MRYCGRCVHQKTRPAPAAELTNIMSSATMDLVCIDYLSLAMSKGRFEHILAITDHFTCYAMAVPTGKRLHRQMTRSCLTISLHIMDFLPYFIATRPKILNPELLSICVRWLVWRRLGPHHITLWEIVRLSASTRPSYEFWVRWNHPRSLTGSLMCCHRCMHITQTVLSLISYVWLLYVCRG